MRRSIARAAIHAQERAEELARRAAPPQTRRWRSSRIRDRSRFWVGRVGGAVLHRRLSTTEIAPEHASPHLHLRRRRRGHRAHPRDPRTSPLPVRGARRGGGRGRTKPLWQALSRHGARAFARALRAQGRRVDRRRHARAREDGRAARAAEGGAHRDAGARRVQVGRALPARRRGDRARPARRARVAAALRRARRPPRPVRARDAAADGRGRRRRRRRRGRWFEAAAAQGAHRAARARRGAPPRREGGAHAAEGPRRRRERRRRRRRALCGGGGGGNAHAHAWRARAAELATSWRGAGSARAPPPARRRPPLPTAPAASAAATSSTRR